MLKIKSICKGYLNMDYFYSLDEKDSSIVTEKVTDIREESKKISANNIIIVYRGYNENKPVFEMTTDGDITIIFTNS